MPTMQVIHLAAVLSSSPSPTTGTSLFTISGVLLAAIAATASLTTAIAGAFLFRRQAREAERRAAYLADDLDRLQKDQATLSREQISSINVNVERLVESLQSDQSRHSTTEGGIKKESEDIIREVSHSINTPLGQIELTLDGLAKKLRVSEPDSPLLKAAARAEQSVQICRAVLAAYRELTSIALVAPQWDIHDLKTVVHSATDVFITQSGRSSDNIDVEIRLPDSITGYSNYFVVSLLLPLLQNAVEATLPRSLIACYLEPLESGFYRFNVANREPQPPDLQMLTVPGYTTKKGGHEGVGIASVRTLLARQAHLGARLDFDWIDISRMFIATVTLPLLKGSDQ